MGSRFFTVDVGGDREFRVGLPTGGGSVRDERSYFLGRAEPPGELTYRHKMGPRVPGDVVSATWVATSFLRRQILEDMREAGLTGWSSIPTRIVVGEEEVVGFERLVVTGRSGPIDKRSGERTMVQFPGGMFEHLRGVRIDDSSWDGSDLFIAGGAVELVGSERFAAFCNDRKLKVFDLVAFEDVLVDPDDLDL